jgi:Family of unknown function (DUF6166)
MTNYTYRGTCTPGQMDWKVTVEHDHKDEWRIATLDPRRDLRDHSPDGFAWGYGGSGPAQLALAMLAHHFRHWSGLIPKRADELAQRCYQDFKAAVIARLDQDAGRTMTSHDIEDAIFHGNDVHMSRRDRATTMLSILRAAHPWMGRP